MTSILAVTFGDGDLAEHIEPQPVQGCGGVRERRTRRRAGGVELAGQEAQQGEGTERVHDVMEHEVDRKSVV